MQGDYRFSRAGGTGDTSRPVIVALDPLTLCGMKKDRPFVPREIEGALQLLHIVHHPETALRIGMRKRINLRGSGGSHERPSTGR